jgi:hypothetical protein
MRWLFWYGGLSVAELNHIEMCMRAFTKEASGLLGGETFDGVGCTFELTALEV